MSRYIRFGSAAAILILLGLACSESGTQPKHVQLTFSQSDCHDTWERPLVGDLAWRGALSPSFQSPCLDGGQLAKTTVASSSGAVRFAAGHDTLFVYHDSAFYNCCSNIMFDVDLQDSVVDFIEVDTAKALCDCLCHFNLGSYLSGLSRGTYTARLWTEKRDSLLGETVIFVPGSNVVWFESHCDTLTVHHDGDSANCCSKIIFGLEQQGNLLEFTEIDTSSVSCRCMCSFDLIAQVSGLSPGQYTVRVRDAAGDSLLDTAIVQIAPCLPR